MGGALIHTDGLAKDYRVGAHVIHAVSGLSVTIRPGEFVAVIGPSGSGKSTFINLLGCLDTPTAGRYVFEDTDVSRLDDDRLAYIRNAKIGFVFQTFNLLPRTTALENVELPLLYSGIPPRQHRARARTTLALVGLSDREWHHPAQLSGGQQQRVAIARALANDPVLILADEPTGNLDTRSGVEIMAVLQELNRRGIAIVLVTHEHDIVRYASRLLTFRDGALVSDEVLSSADARETLAALGPASPRP